MTDRSDCGICYSPAEVAAREAAAFRRGAEAMRKSVIEYIAGVADRCAGLNAIETYGNRSDYMRNLIQPYIRALPVPDYAATLAAKENQNDRSQ